MHTELLGLSIDSTYAHIAWVRSIQDKFGVEIPFPIIEDISMKAASHSQANVRRTEASVCTAWNGSALGERAFSKELGSH